MDDTAKHLNAAAKKHMFPGLAIPKGVVRIERSRTGENTHRNSQTEKPVGGGAKRSKERGGVVSAIKCKREIEDY